jgi:MPBQ/MSBQ methyltransferase
MAKKIDTRAVGLDVGLMFIRWLTGAESLHYGLWTGLEVNAGNLRAAQDAYTAKLLGYLPPPPARVLDIGGGAGETAKKLLSLGYQVEIVVPSAFLAARCRANAPGAVVHETVFETAVLEGRFDVCLFSESFQYIPMGESLPKCLGLLAPAGRIVIADCFRTEAYRGRHAEGPKPGGGHALAGFRAVLGGLPLRGAAEEDITEAVAPSIDLEQSFYNVLGLGLLRLRAELAEKRPASLWILGKFLAAVLSRKRRANLMARLTERERTGAAFAAYTRYLMLRLDVLPQG